MNTFICFRCKKQIIHNEPHTTGYGLDRAHHKICFACCAIVDENQMIKNGKIVLYLVTKDGINFITNWPGTLSFAVQKIKESRHNIAGVRRDAWFKDKNKSVWHGVQFGHWSQLCHCKKNRHE
jgi:hypothetical protein